MTALFAVEGISFKTHAGIQSAVHRDLVKSGRWQKGLGAGYSFLLKARTKADYGGGLCVLDNEAEKSLESAALIIQAVHDAHSGIFKMQ